MGRSRKPLIVCAIRGFESHPLRHQPARKQTAGKQREEDIPAEQPASQEETRFPRPHADETRAGDSLAPPPQGPQAPHGLTLSRASSPRCNSGVAPGAGRIRSSRDYRRVYRRGRRLHGDIAVFHVRENDAGHPRLGLTASRRVGGAVVRNRLRRRVREHYRQQVRRDKLPAVDVVVHLKAAAAEANRRSFYRELDRLFRAAGRYGPRRSRLRRSSRS